MPNSAVKQTIILEAANPDDEHKEMKFEGPDVTDLITVTIAGMTCRIRGVDLREAVRRMS